MVSVLLGLVLATTPPLLVPQSPVLEVNCDTGQSLEKALVAIQKSPGATIRIRGTCVGNFILNTGGVRLEGVAGGQALLKAPDPRDRRAVLMVKGASDVEIRSLHFQHGGQSGVGLLFDHSHRARVFDCEFDQNEAGVAYQWSDDGEVWRSSMHDNKCGVCCTRRSTVYVQLSSIRNNLRQGLLAFVNSDLGVGSSEVVGNGSGLGAQIQSSVNVYDVALRDNGDTHLFANDRSSVNLVSEVSIGGPEDRTRWSAGVGAGSRLTAGSNSTFYGDLYVSGNSYLQLGELTVDGRILAWSFSRVSLSRTLVSKEAYCMNGADLNCDFGAQVAAFDCSSAGACQHPAAIVVPTDRPQPPELPALLEPPTWDLQE